jgi:hypothetical protein
LPLQFCQIGAEGEGIAFGLFDIGDSFPQFSIYNHSFQISRPR